MFHRKINGKSTLSLSVIFLSSVATLSLAPLFPLSSLAGKAQLLVVPPRAEVVVEKVEVQARLQGAGDPHCVDCWFRKKACV